MDYSRMAEQRKKLGLSQEELATKLKISQKSISKYELGHRRPSYETLVAMASIFDVSVDYLLGNDIVENSDRKCNNADKTNEPAKQGYFFFFFDDEELLRDTFSKRIKTAIADMGLTEDEFKDAISFNNEKATSFLTGNVEPTAKDLIELSRFLNTSIDYLLGQVPKLNNKEKNLLNTFVKLNEDNQDIIIGKVKELIKDQKFESVAADSMLLKKTGTSNLGK